MGLQIFGIYGQRLLELGNGIGVTFFEEEDAAEFVVDDAVAGELLENHLQVCDGAVVVAVFAQDFSVEEIGSRQLRVDRERFFEHLARAASIALLYKHAADVGPAIGILRIGFGDFFEGRGCSFQVALQEKSDAVIVPARPVFLRADYCRPWRCGTAWQNTQRLCVFRKNGDRQIRNRFDFARNVRSVAVECKLSVIIVRSGFLSAAARELSHIFGNAGKGELRVVPAEFAVVQLGVQRNFVATVFRNVQVVVHCIGRAWRNQVDVNDGARGPGIALVDDVAVAVNLERTVEMRAGINGAFAVVFDLSAPENGLAFFVGSLEFDPYVEGIHSATGEKVADFARSNDDIHANIIATTNRSVGTIDRSRDRADFTGRAFWQPPFGLFSYGERGREFLFAQLVANWSSGFLFGGRDGENIHAQLLVLEECFRKFVLRFVPVGRGHGGIRTRKTMRMHETVDVAIILGWRHRHVAVGAVHGALRIIKGARALAGDAAGLPVIVLVEAANPAVTVHGNVEMHLMAGRAKLRGLRAHKGLQKGAAMWFGIQAYDEIVQLANKRIFARG